MGIRVFVTGIGIMSSLGSGTGETTTALMLGERGVRPLSLFPVSHIDPLPAGEIQEPLEAGPFPRTHILARRAAKEAMEGAAGPPDAVVLGTATGGMPTTESLLKQAVSDPSRYRYHGAGTVGDAVADAVGCRGPVLTVSTACSSGSVALTIALGMLRCGQAESVLAGGADALCRLTYYGFHALQLVDPAGAHPLDRRRRGMTVAEGAALLLLTAAERPPANALCELLGAGLSCDAFHAAAPQPEGLGALRAMRNALADAGLQPGDIDYIHLHGTGTIDNDLAEAKALHALFGRRMPLLSSTKGATGHALAAAGAIGTVLAAVGIHRGIVPASTGCETPDPELKLNPLREPWHGKIESVLVNAFGFGGNNAVLVMSRPGKFDRPIEPAEMRPLSIQGMACLTGAGDAEATMKRLRDGFSIRGLPEPGHLSLQPLDRRSRRMKRLPHLALALAMAACEDDRRSVPPEAVFFGTGWGPLSEAYDFLMKLFQSEDRFTSPSDFVGSVHNAAAAQVGLRYGATGPNLTLSGGDYSFEQALMTAGLIMHEREQPFLLMGVDEHHPVLSPLLAAASSDGPPVDGGAAFNVSLDAASGPTLFPLFLAASNHNPLVVQSLAERLGRHRQMADRYAAVFAGIPASAGNQGLKQLHAFLSITGFTGPVLDYRRWTGDFASASAVATFIAAQCVKKGEIPPSLCHQGGLSLSGRGILLVGLGDAVTALEVMP